MVYSVCSYVWGGKGNANSILVLLKGSQNFTLFFPQPKHQQKRKSQVRNLSVLTSKHVFENQHSKPVHYPLEEKV